MEDRGGHSPTRRKRGRPRTHATSEAKSAADVKRRRVARQDASFRQRDTSHTNFYNSFLPPAHEEGGAYPPTLHPDVLDLAKSDISPFLPPTDHPWSKEVDDPVLFDGETSAPAFSAVATPTPDDANQDEEGPSLASPEATPPPRTEESEDIRHLAVALAEQLIRFQGCCHDCHQTAKQSSTNSTDEQIGLAAYLDATAGLCPDVLSCKTLASQTDDLAGQLRPEARKQVFCGLDPRDDVPHITLDQDERVSSGAGVTFDVDSTIAFPSSLAVAKRGIRWSPTRMAVSDLRSNLHLRLIPVRYFDTEGVPHQVHRPVHQVPHYTFGRVVGLEDVSLYLLFPRLYRAEQTCSKIRDEDFQLWTDGILLPAIHRMYSSAHAQHYPSSHEHSRYNATARGVEMLAQHVHPVAREQQLVYCLPPEPLADLWADILDTTQKAGFHQFQDVTILLQAKNLKTMTKDVTWAKMVTRFDQYWAHAIDERYTTEDVYIDVGKETCPQQGSKVGPWPLSRQEDDHDLEDVPAETLLYKRCCLQAHASQVEHAVSDRGSQKQVFYPFTMLRDTGSLTVETGKRSPRRAAGLLYSQFYPSIKEVFAAGNVYPFTNPAIESLALDKKLRKTWELVGGGLSHQPVALVKAYLYTKLRCHFASLGSMAKSFGIREEHRVSRGLFQAMGRHFQSCGLDDQRLVTPTDDSSPYYSFTTQTVLQWVRWNINKFCVGFEMVHSFQDAHFVTWEHTRIMLMFLRCLQFSYGGGLLRKVGGCWQDVREQPDVEQLDRVRRYEGLGFQRTIERYGYAWFMDKIDWHTLTFRPPHAAYMMFNNPSMQTVYRARYHQVRDVRIDFIRVDKAYQWMLAFSAVPACLELLGDYLRELCLCAFRKDVFFHIKSAPKPDCMEAALAGSIPLCYASVQNAMRQDSQPLPLAEGNRLAVKDIDVLFAWLWLWKDDHFERQGWKEKPYRMLFQQSFYAIQTARGKAGARRWRRELKRSFLGSHWLLPYPHSRGFMRKDREDKQFLWWPSAHQGLIRHYAQSPWRERGTLARPLPAHNVRYHPADGWTLASTSWRTTHMPYVIEPEQTWIRMPEDVLYSVLLRLREQASTDSSSSLFTSLTWALDNSPVASYFPSRWCTFRRMQVAKTFDECDEVNEGLWFLRNGLEKYENLGRHRPAQRRRRGKRTAAQLDSDSDSVSGQEEAEATSDEESLAAMRTQQAEAIRKMDARVRVLVGEFQKRYPQWQKAFNPAMREIDNRLEKVE